MESSSIPLIIIKPYLPYGTYFTRHFSPQGQLLTACIKLPAVESKAALLQCLTIAAKELPSCHQ